MRKSISILKEIRAGERRVILQPEAVGRFVERGFDVLVESGAGTAASRPDEEYRAVGARIVSTEAAWTESGLVFKYKAPDPSEYRFFRRDLCLGAFLHAEGNLALVEAMRASGMTALAYEFYQTPAGVYPLAVSDNEIAGKIAVLYGAYHLQGHLGGSGVLLCNEEGARRARVLVIGYGNVGGAAARLAASMGAEVVVLGTNREALRRFAATMPANVRCRFNTPEAIAEEVPQADLVVGAILISTHDTPPMIDEALVRRMRPGSMIVDVTCGYGAGYLPTFDSLTTHQSPVYERHGILHCKIDALPASVPLTAAQATSANIGPYLEDLAERHFSGTDPLGARDGVVVSAGRHVHPEILRHVELAAAAKA
jgi:alanine dehydrogenase